MPRAETKKRRPVLTLSEQVDKTTRYEKRWAEKGVVEAALLARVFPTPATAVFTAKTPVNPTQSPDG